MGRCYCQHQCWEGNQTQQEEAVEQDTKTWLLYSISPKFETVLRNNLLKMIFLGFHTRPAQAESWGGLGKRHAHVSLQNRSWTMKGGMRKAKERESEKVAKR